MVTRPFIASPPADQNAETYRQFRDLQTYLQDLEDRARASSALYLAEDITLTDDWQPLVVQGGLGALRPGAYTVSMTAFAEGSNANAEAQFRVVSGQTQIPGAVLPIGNARFMISSNLIVPQGAPVDGFEARGISCALSVIRVQLVRIGVRG